MRINEYKGFAQSEKLLSLTIVGKMWDQSPIL